MHRRYVLVGIACAFATVDLVQKSASNATYYHARSLLAALAIGALTAGLVMFVPRVPSRAALLGAAIACGGALGNLVSLLAWSQGVPDPIVVHGATQDVAFNLADVFAVTGDAMLLAAVVLHGLRRRERLHEPV